MTCYVVYSHTNRLNSKRYVGWAKGSSPHDAMKRRWEEHCRNKRNDLFPRAIRKHGIDVWDHDILEVMTTRKEVTRAEKLWIAELKTFAFDEGNLGYNMTRGGDGGQRKGLKRSDKTRKKSVMHVKENLHQIREKKLLQPQRKI